MPQPSDLTTLQAVKFWLQGNGTDPAWTGTASDAQLGVYIAAASRAALGYMERNSLLNRTINELRSGTRTGAMLLREFPVTAINSLSIGNIVVPARPSLTASSVVSASPYGPLGYVLDPWDGAPPGRPQQLLVDGFSFYKGALNVQINYNAGYAIIGEVFTIPGTPFKYTPAQPYGRWAQDISITYLATGTKLAPVASNPAAGQYVTPSYPATLATPADPQAQYLFATADAGQQALLSYSYVPYDVDQVVAKWVGEWWSYRTRIGQKSKALPSGQGTSSFDLSAMPEDVKLVLKNYKKAIPL